MSALPVLAVDRPDYDCPDCGSPIVIPVGARIGERRDDGTVEILLRADDDAIREHAARHPADHPQRAADWSPVPGTCSRCDEPARLGETRWWHLGTPCRANGPQADFIPDPTTGPGVAA